MKLAAIASPFTDESLRPFVQLGVPDIVSYNMMSMRTDTVGVFQAHRDIGYCGLIRPDHVPQVITESGENDGCGMHGNIYAIGYIKGLMEPLWGKPDRP
jgi:D-mannonate dehydratase